MLGGFLISQVKEINYSGSEVVVIDSAGQQWSADKVQTIAEP